MAFQQDLNPSLRQEAARRAQELMKEDHNTCWAATAHSYQKLVKNREEEFEAGIVQRRREWLDPNDARLKAILPLILPAWDKYERLCGAYRSEIAAALRKRDEITPNRFAPGRDGRRDPNVLRNTINAVNIELDRCCGLAGSLDRIFKQIEVQLLAIEKRGGGLPPEPVPLAKDPTPEPSSSTITTNKQFNVRRSRT